VSHQNVPFTEFRPLIRRTVERVKGIEPSFLCHRGIDRLSLRERMSMNIGGQADHVLFFVLPLWPTFVSIQGLRIGRRVSVTPLEMGRKSTGITDKIEAERIASSWEIQASRRGNRRK